MIGFRNIGVTAKYNAITAALLSILFSAFIYNSYKREESLLTKASVDHARTIARQIIETRDYLSRYASDISAKNSDIIPQVAATRIAKRMTDGSGYYVRQVSLRYRNSDNRPDDYETAKLESFKKGNAAESWSVVTEYGTTAFRYIFPMQADESCMLCHSSFERAPAFVQSRFPKGHLSYGYSVGEVIGAVSVALPMQKLQKEVLYNIRKDAAWGGVVLVLLMVSSSLIIHRSILSPVKQVSSGIAAVAKSGNYAERIGEKAGNDEIGELIRSFNELMGELERKTLQRFEAEERYRNFIEIAQSPIITFMADGKILISNSKAEKLFKMTKDELLGQCVYDLMEKGEQLKSEATSYLEQGGGELIGAATKQQVRDVCGNLMAVEMVISVSQSEQNQIFTAILRSGR